MYTAVPKKMITIAPIMTLSTMILILTGLLLKFHHLRYVYDYFFLKFFLCVCVFYCDHALVFFFFFFSL